MESNKSVYIKFDHQLPVEITAWQLAESKFSTICHEINSISIDQIKIQLIEASLTVIARLIHINYVTIVLYQMFLD